jgi:hypothetical protein
MTVTFNFKENLKDFFLTFITLLRVLVRTVLTYENGTKPVKVRIFFMKSTLSYGMVQLKLCQAYFFARQVAVNN